MLGRLSGLTRRALSSKASTERFEQWVEAMLRTEVNYAGRHDLESPGLEAKNQEQLIAEHFGEQVNVHSRKIGPDHAGDIDETLWITYPGPAKRAPFSIAELSGAPPQLLAALKSHDQQAAQPTLALFNAFDARKAYWDLAKAGDVQGLKNLCAFDQQHLHGQGLQQALTQAKQEHNAAVFNTLKAHTPGLSFVHYRVGGLETAINSAQQKPVTRAPLQK